VLDPNPPKGFEPNVDPPNPVVVVEGLLVPKPASVLGVAVLLLMLPGLCDRGAPKKEVVPAFVDVFVLLPFVVPFVADIPRPSGGGFFFVAPDSPRAAGWLGLMLEDASRVGLFGGAGLLSLLFEEP